MSDLKAAHSTSGDLDAYRALLAHQRSNAVLASAGSVLGWDQEVMMPAGGLEQRSGQLAELTSVTHARATDPRVGDWLSACEEDPGIRADPASVAAVNVRWWRHGYDRATRLPPELVVEMSRATSAGKAAWAEARQRKATFRCLVRRSKPLCGCVASRRMPTGCRPGGNAGTHWPRVTSRG